MPTDALDAKALDGGDDASTALAAAESGGPDAPIARFRGWSVVGGADELDASADATEATVVAAGSSWERSPLRGEVTPSGAVAALGATLVIAARRTTVVGAVGVVTADVAAGRSPLLLTTAESSNTRLVATTAPPASSTRSGVIVNASTPTRTSPTAASATIRTRPVRVVGSGGGAGSSDGWRHERSCGGSGPFVTES